MSEAPRPPENSPPKIDQDPADIQWDSTELLQGQQEVLIRHGETTYRLRATRQGKLILHK